MSLDLLAGLDDGQRAVVEAVRGPVAVRAVAGAGKTRAVTRRIAYAVTAGAQSAHHGLAITYTTKAAAELRHRLLQLGVGELAAATIHSAAWRQLRHFWPRALGGEPWRVLSARTALLDAAAAAAGLDLAPAVSRSLRAEVEWAKAQGLDPAAYLELGRTPEAGAAAVAEVWGRYTDLCHQQRLLDFDDVLVLAAGMLQSRPDIADEVRSRYRWFTVDEYQDITPMQQLLLELWLGESREICVVGDPDQSIFEFAGANPDFLRQFGRTYPDALTVELRQSYRCPPAVVELANSVLTAVPGSLSLRPAATNGAAAVREFDTAAGELAGLAAEVGAWLTEGVDPREVAVLVRTGAQADEVQAALDAAGVPSVSRGAIRFAGSPVIRVTLLALKAESFDGPVTDLVDLVERLAFDQGWRSDPQAAPIAREEWAALSALVALARDLRQQQPDAGIEELLDLVALRTQSADEPRPEAVTVSTVHLAKGRQWQRVWIPQLVEGRLPFSADLADLLSETRLLHVAITRSSEKVVLSRAALDAAGRPLPPSRFWQLVEAATPAAPDQSPTPPATLAVAAPVAADEVAVSPLRRCRECGIGLELPLELATGRCQRHPGPARPRLLLALRAFSTQAAAAAAVPEWQVLTDTALAAIVEHLPQSRVELRGLHGITEAKLADYGDQLLELVAANAD